MSIIVNVDVMLAKRKMTSGELAEKIGITQANLSILKTGKAKAVRFSTLEAICKECGKEALCGKGFCRDCKAEMRKDLFHQT